MAAGRGGIFHRRPGSRPPADAGPHRRCRYRYRPPGHHRDPGALDGAGAGVTEAIYDLHIDDRSDVVIARLTGEIDQSNAAVVGQTLRDRAHGRPLVLDLSAAYYLDSAGIAMLDVLRRTTNLSLVLAPESIVTRALTITGFD